MKRSLPALVESALYFLLVMVFLSAGLMWCAVHTPLRPAWLVGAMSHPWILNQTLTGVAQPLEIKPPAIASILDGTWQSSVAMRFDAGFYGREALVRWTGEGFFRAFGRPAFRVPDLTVGKGDSIISTCFLSELFLRRCSKESLKGMVTAIKTIQSECKSRGQAFVLVITPTKVGLCPEAVPDVWLARRDPRPRARDLLLELLQGSGVPVIDGMAVVKKAEERGDIVGPLCAVGGIHWTSETALYAANAVMEELARQDVAVRPLKVASLEILDTPQGYDADVLGLMNLALPWRYPSPKLILERESEKSEAKPDIVFVGGSFTTAIAELFGASDQFSSISYFFYLKDSKHEVASGLMRKIRSPVSSIDYEKEVFSARALVLEINEASIPSQHVQEFASEIAELSGVPQGDSIPNL